MNNKDAPPPTETQDSLQSPKWGLFRARSVRRDPTEASAPPSSPRVTSFRRISEVAMSKFKLIEGIATQAKRKSSMRNARRATSRETYEEDDEEERVRTSSARYSNRRDSTSPTIEPVSVQCGGASCRGRGKKTNEDRLSMLSHLVQEKESATVGFAGVFDGHAGDKCVDEVVLKISSAIGRHISEAKLSHPDWQTATRVGLKKGIDEVDRDFIQNANIKRDVSGCCGIISIVRGCEVTLAHVGDCCALLIREGKPVQRLTIDHVVENESEIQRIRACGGQIINSRLNGVLKPTRAFGDADLKQAGCGLTAEPDTSYLVVKSGSILVMCSDGITSVLSEAEIGEIILADLKTNNADPSHAAATVCKKAGDIGTDDCSMVIMIFTKEEV